MRRRRKGERHAGQGERWREAAGPSGSDGQVSVGSSPGPTRPRMQGMSPTDGAAIQAPPCRT